MSKHYLQFHLNDNFIFKLNFCGKYNPEILDNVPCFYRDVLYAYNRAKQITDEVFCSNILDQPIWANDHVKYVCKRKGILLYYTNWITMGIVKIRNLRFNNGVLDDEYVYYKVTRKIDIFSEISRLKKALKPYAQYIGDHEPEEDTYLPLFLCKGEALDEFKTCKSRIFYRALTSSKCETSADEIQWENYFNLPLIEF